MLRQILTGLLRVDNTLGALAQGGFEEWNCPSRVSRQSIRKLFIVRDEMGNVDVAVVLSDQSIFSDLVSIDEGAINLKSEDEFSQFGLNFTAWLFSTITKRCKHAERVGTSSVHVGYGLRGDWEESGSEH